MQRVEPGFDSQAGATCDEVKLPKPPSPAVVDQADPRRKDPCASLNCHDLLKVRARPTGAEPHIGKHTF
jgi:hypothetical protein